MKILIIDFNTDISSIGIRIISSYLRENGHKTNLLFLPKISREDRVQNKFAHKEDKEELELIADFIKKSNPGIISMSLMTNFFHRAVELTNILKKDVDVPIVWGGVHVTISPEECLKYADIVCIGEGEETFLELANKIEAKQDYNKVQGIWLKNKGGIIKNPVRALVEDLDKYPIPDYDLNAHYILHNGKIRTMNEDLVRIYSSKYLDKEAYRIITSRGCPFSCSYCYNSILRDLYPNKERYHRRRSVANIIKELEWAKSKFSFVKLIRIMDDSFMATNEEWIKEFSYEYKKRIGLPISCLINPQTVTEKKAAYLKSAGLVHIQMGIESYEKINREVYNRYTTDKQILDITQLLKGIVCEYDFIIDNPYETKEDKINKIKLLLKIPKPYILALYSLTLYPHTPLYERAEADKKLYSGNADYNKNMSYVNNEYLNSLLLLTPHLPSKLIDNFLRKDDIFHKFIVGIIRLNYEFAIRLPAPVKKILVGCIKS